MRVTDIVLFFSLARVQLSENARMHRYSKLSLPRNQSAEGFMSQSYKYVLVVGMFTFTGVLFCKISVREAKVIVASDSIAKCIRWCLRVHRKIA